MAFLRAIHGIEVDARGRAINVDTILRRARAKPVTRDGRPLETFIDDSRRLLKIDRSEDGKYMVTELHRDGTGEGRISRAFFSDLKKAEAYCSISAAAYRKMWPEDIKRRK